MTMTTDGTRELIAELRGWTIDDAPRSIVSLMYRAADALEAATSERAAVPGAATEQDECALPGHAGCTRVIVDGEPWFDHFPAETEWEYAWEADEEKRAQMKPRGPRMLLDGQPHYPDEIARFPKGRRMYRTKAGPWLPVPGGEGEGDE